MAVRVCMCVCARALQAICEILLPVGLALIQWHYVSPHTKHHQQPVLVVAVCCPLLDLHTHLQTQKQSWLLEKYIINNNSESNERVVVICVHSVCSSSKH